MKIFHKFYNPISTCLVVTTTTILLHWTLFANVGNAQRPEDRIPDFTAGDEIPKEMTHDWNLGPTGARGWMYSKKMVTTDARQIKITQVDADSPAARVLSVGDVILGVAGTPFTYDPRTEFGKAVEGVETEKANSRLILTRWREGRTQDVAIQLQVHGSYGPLAPYDCPKSQRILEQGCQVLAQRMRDPNYSNRQNPIVRCLNGLALLASGDPNYLPLVKTEAEWAADFSEDSFQTWYYGYATIFLAEYILATGDESVLPGLERLTLAAATGQSIVGSWGHKFAGMDGRLQGYGMMNSPGIPLTIGMILAQKAGVSDPRVSEAIEKSARLIRFYVGKGAVPYGDHHPWIETHEDNGKCGMAAIMFSLLEEWPAAEYFARMSLASHGAERDTGHTGNFFNMLWALPAIDLLGPEATGAWHQEFGGWYFDFSRKWDGSFAHQGPPQPRPDSYRAWDATSSYLLAYALPLKKIHLTGKAKSAIPALDTEAASLLIADGRGWDNKDRHGFYDSLSDKELLDRLGSWSPTVRERSAAALGRRRDVSLTLLTEMCESPQLTACYGACEGLAQLKGKAAPAVPALERLLTHEDLWLRIKAADALAAIGEPAMTTVPTLLKMLARGPSELDPRGMEQRYLTFALFDRRAGLLRRSLDGVDRELLYEAVRAGLTNQDGRSRGSLGSVYQQLSYEELKPLLPAIYEATATPAPSGIMFADEIRLAGIDLLAKHRLEEGMALCLDIMNINSWGEKRRIAHCLETLNTYGAAAKPLVPRLRQLQIDLAASNQAHRLQEEMDYLSVMIESIEKSTDQVELKSIFGAPAGQDHQAKPVSADGWTPLFPMDGKPEGWRVTEWSDVAKTLEGYDWTVNQGVLRSGDQRGTWLISHAQYQDFELQFEIKLTERGNSGVALRSPGKGDPAFDGLEFQIADFRYNTNATAAELTGGLYRAVAPTKQVYKPTQWNHVHIELAGSKFRASINGELIQDIDLREFDQPVQRHDDTSAPALKDRPLKGHIGFQHLSREGHVEIRNARIKLPQP